MVLMPYFKRKKEFGSNIQCQFILQALSVRLQQQKDLYQIFTIFNVKLNLKFDQSFNMAKYLHSLVSLFTVQNTTLVDGKNGLRSRKPRIFLKLYVEKVFTKT